MDENVLARNHAGLNTSSVPFNADLPCAINRFCERNHRNFRFGHEPWELRRKGIKRKKVRLQECDFYFKNLVASLIKFYWMNFSNSNLIQTCSRKARLVEWTSRGGLKISAQTSYGLTFQICNIMSKYLFLNSLFFANA